MSKFRFISRLTGAMGAALLAASIGGGCSGATGGSNLAGSGGNGGSGASTGSGGSGFGGGAGFGAGPGSGFDAGNGTGGGTSADASCAGQATKAQQLPLDIFIMLDQSGSMTETVSGGGTKWDAVTGALKSFVTQPNLSGISVGIQYFGLPPSGSGNCNCNFDSDCPSGDFCDFGTCFSCEIGSDSCNAADYSKADVEIAPLPGVAQSIIDSINAHSPNTGTPTMPALQGAIQHAKDWATAHPGHVVIDIFATDGDPLECDTNQSHIEGVASAGFNGSPSIATFVIGVGSQLSALNGVAAAGGTKQAFIVDTTQNVNQQFMAALNAIRGAALGCNYSIPVPESGLPDYSKVNVEYTPGGSSTPQVLPHVADKASCPATGNAWYYDDPKSPTQILLCDATCATLSQDSTGEVDVVLGCQTIVN